MYPSNEISIMEQDTLPQLNATSYISTYQAERLFEDLLPHPDDFEIFGFLDLAPLTTPSSDMPGTIDPSLLTSSSTSMYSPDDFESMAEYSPAPLTTPPSSDMSATIDTSLLTSSAPSLHSPEDNINFLSFSAEQALLGITDSQSLFSATPITIPHTLTTSSPAYQHPPPHSIILTSCPLTTNPTLPPTPQAATPGPPPTLGTPTTTHPLHCPHPTCPSRILFTRPCDLRKHLQRHTKTLSCRRPGCPQATAPAFSSKKDRARHEASHDPGVGCVWAGCARVFSRADNMRDHVGRVHLGKSGRGGGGGGGGSCGWARREGGEERLGMDRFRGGGVGGLGSHAACFG